MTETAPSPRVIAHLRTSRSEHPGATSGPTLLRVLDDLTADGATWWLLAEQSDGYVAGRRDPGAPSFTLAGTTRLNPALLFDARVFSEGAELRVGQASTGVTVWAHEYLPEHPGLPEWVAPHVRPLDVTAVLAEPDSAAGPGEAGFTRVVRGNGQVTLIPVDHAAFGKGTTRLRIRRHFTWASDTGRVWVGQECLAGYTQEGEVA